ncbi:MAG: type I glutamate--ammonia ligase [Alphaproteobacteria bacterium]|nr:type I glutamate--ammonia ligase [Alphaproteobacteria bacterium]
MSANILKFKNNTALIKFIDENDIQFIDLNFTDLRGKWHHTTEHVSAFGDDKLRDGVYFDGSSIAGWRDIDNSDMNIRPDITRVCLDPFAAQKTIKIICDVIDPQTGRPYERDPRQIAKAAEAYLKKATIGDTAYFGPEAEFFIFDDVRIDVAPHHVGFRIDSEEGPYNSGRHYETGNKGHRPGPKGGYFPDSPVDSLSDIRGEMVTVMQSMGISVEKHHHEVAPSQCEIGILYSTLTNCADNIQIYKHVVQNVANSYGKTATFMPKPIFGDNGSGMHVHQSIWNKGDPLFAGSGYAGLSDIALYYIGGIIRHARALNAFTNPTTNSYKRLVPGYEAPVLLAYSANNRSASCRIPHAGTQAGKRVEVRFPDPCANPYLALAAMLMAGLDGIENKIHPGEAMDKNLYHLSKEDQSRIPTVCGSLRDALAALESDKDFLMKGDVFSQDIIDAYIALKREELDTYETMVHPVEYSMYYSS